MVALYELFLLELEHFSLMDFKHLIPSMSFVFWVFSYFKFLINQIETSLSDGCTMGFF